MVNRNRFVAAFCLLIDVNLYFIFLFYKKKYFFGFCLFFLSFFIPNYTRYDFSLSVVLEIKIKLSFKASVRGIQQLENFLYQCHREDVRLNHRNCLTTVETSLVMQNMSNSALYCVLCISAYIIHCWAKESFQIERVRSVVPTRPQIRLGISHTPLNWFLS